ncbi:MAG TPA: hypothetical protein VKY19_29350 [Ktedonosporobacter sp.]|nr:hypothetical protein [Ktedonosporobacter sp.]
MSVTRMTPNYSQSSSQRCNRCHIPIPRNATFCGTCGERFDKQNSTQLLNKADIADRYRITSLVRRRPYVQLFIAIDHLRQQPVVIRDIDLSSLDESGQAQALEMVQQEHDRLRKLCIQDLMPIIDLRSFQGHLYTIAAWPFGFHQHERGYSDIPRYTLQDLLQSGIGLPEEQIAISWLYRICQAVERLHQEEIILGDLDPYAIIVSDQEYDGLPALMISWLPLSLQNLLPYISTATNIVPASVTNTLRGSVEKQTDIYSLGALLYLLLTGTSPEEPGASMQHLLRPVRPLTPGINSNVDTIIKRALTTKSEERFQSAAEMTDALLELCLGSSVQPANSVSNQYMQTRVLKHSPIPEPGRTLSPGDSGDATIIAPLPQLRRKITKVLTSSLKMRVAHMNEASGASANAKHPNDPQSIIIEELSMGTEPTTETEAMLEPSAAKMETVVEPSAEETKKVIEPPTTETGKGPESSSATEMATPPITETAMIVEPPSSDAEAMTDPPVPEAEETNDPAGEPVTITGPLLTEAEAASLEQATEVQTEPESSPALIEIEVSPSEDEMNELTETVIKLPEDETVTPAETITGPLPPEVTAESEPSNGEAEIENEPFALAAEEPKADTPSAQVEERIEPIAPATIEEQFLQDAQVIEYSLAQTVPLQNGHTVEATQGVDAQTETGSAPAAEQTSVEAKPAQEEQPPTQPLPDSSADAVSDGGAIPDMHPSLVQRMLEHVSGVLPAIVRPTQKGAETQEEPLLKRLQRFVLGEQQHTTTAAALIETPLRIQPNQIYSIRIHMMGRDEPDPGSIYGGLSAVTKGETVHIEVRSALYRNFAYIVQQADVTMPGKGYAAEVTMPMQAFTQGPSGRRERLHIFFTDEARRPLYERPFVIEVFISHLVQSGREGHNVLSIPL